MTVSKVQISAGRGRSSYNGTVAKAMTIKLLIVKLHSSHNRHSNDSILNIENFSFGCSLMILLGLINLTVLKGPCLLKLTLDYVYGTRQFYLSA